MADTYRFHTKPMAHQRAGLRNIIANRGVYGLLWEPGVGKTKPTIDYLGMLTEARGSCLALVLAPLSAVDTWPDEVDTHLPPRIRRSVVLPTGRIVDKAEQVREVACAHHEAAGGSGEAGLTLVVMNLDVLSANNRVRGTRTVTTRTRMMDAIRSAQFDVAICDESHRAKGRSSNLSRALGSLSRDLPRRLILTGTVAPHSPMDLWAQWRFLNPDRFGRWSDFEERYAVMGGFRGKQHIAFRNLHELRELRAADSMVVHKADALDLPPTTDRIVPVTLTARERSAYDQLASTMVLPQTPSGQPVLTPTALVQWLRLRQLTSGYAGRADTDPTGATGIERFGHSKTRVAVDLLSDLVAADEKVVVFCHFRDEIDDVWASTQRALPAAVPVEVITGDTPQSERRTIRKRFLDHDGPFVVVAQVRTVSLAVNEFVAASHALFLSMSERRDDYEQARDRLDRKGQTRAVTYHHLVVKGTLDEVILRAHRTKQSLEHAVLQYARTLPTTTTTEDDEETPCHSTGPEHPYTSTTS